MRFQVMLPYNNQERLINKILCLFQGRGAYSVELQLFVWNESQKKKKELNKSLFSKVEKPLSLVFSYF